MIYATALAGAIIWLGLNGLLWYTRPSDLFTVTSPPIMRASGNGKAEAGAAEALRRRLA